MGNKRRLCGCGCGRALDGRADQRYVNATHRKRGERERRGERVSVTSVTARLTGSRPSERGHVSELGLSRLQDRRGAAEVHRRIYAAAEVLWRSGPVGRAEFEDLLDALRVIPRRNPVPAEEAVR